MERQKNGRLEAEKGKWAAYRLFLAGSYVLTGLLLLALAFLLFQFELSGKAVELGIIATYLISTFIAGFMAGKKAKSRKYLWGFLMGTTYFLILAVLSLLMRTGGDGAKLLTSFLLCAGGGTLGGMLS